MTTLSLNLQLTLQALYRVSAEQNFAGRDIGLPHANLYRASRFLIEHPKPAKQEKNLTPAGLPCHPRKYPAITLFTTAHTALGSLKQTYLWIYSDSG